MELSISSTLLEGVDPFPKMWLLLTGKWRILTTQLETICEFSTKISGGWKLAAASS
jgi:hypothetical protein